MEKNKTLILSILVLFLGAAAAWYMFSGDKNTTVSGADRRFAIKNTEEIQKIFLADRAGNTTLLERTGDSWIYNSKWKVRPTAIKNLLEAIRNVEMMYKPSLAAVPNMVKSLAAEGIKVEIYDRQNKLLKAYYVGGATADETGTYMILEGAEQPYVTYIPGWTGNIRYRYSLKGEDWRDRTVMAFTPDEIISVSVEYPKNQNQSFILEKKERTYEVKPFYALTPQIRKPYRNRSAESYLTGFEQLGAEAFENNNPARDSISQLVPFAIVKIKDAQGEAVEARFHPIFSNTAYQDVNTGKYLSAPPVDRYFAHFPATDDFFLVQDRVFQKIFRPYNFFFEP
jgi:hypothetical protein